MWEKTVGRVAVPVPRIENKARLNMGEGSIPSNGGSVGPRLSRVPRTLEEAILTALGDPMARAILLRLSDRPASVQEVTQSSGLPQASVYRKLRELQECGLVGVQRSTLSADGHRTDLFRSLLVEARLTYRGSSIELLASFRALAAERLSEMWETVRGGGAF